MGRRGLRGTLVPLTWFPLLVHNSGNDRKQVRNKTIQRQFHKINNKWVQHQCKGDDEQIHQRKCFFMKKKYHQTNG